MKKFLRELGAFASQRSVADVALGIIIGAALGNFVNVIVEEIILPPISFFTQSVNLENQAIVLREAGSINGVIPIEDIAIGYGKLIEVSIEFVVIGLALFFLIKSTRRLWQQPSSLNPDVPESVSSRDTELLERTVALLEEQNSLLQKKTENK